MTVELVKSALVEARRALDQLIDNGSMLARIDEAAQILANGFGAGARAFSCGNGGSMCDPCTSRKS